MNPFPAARWTEEDTDIWVRLLKRGGLYRYAVALQWFQGQDQRDARFMLLLARTRGQWMSVPDWYEMLEKAGLEGYGEFTVAALYRPLNAISHKG
jgi:hypothetical protein